MFTDTIFQHLPQYRGPLKALHQLVKVQLWAQILVAMAVGVLTGVALSTDGWHLVSPAAAHRIAEWLALPGQIFLGLIQMIVIPLVMSSLLIGIAANKDADTLKRLGLRVVPYFITTTTIAVMLGLMVVNLITPGDYIDQAVVQANLGSQQTAGTQVQPLEQASLPSRIVSIIPTNPLEAALEQSMFQIVVFAILIGIAAVTLAPDRAAPVIDLATAMMDIAMRIVSWAMHLVPYAVFGLLAQITTKVGIDILVGMGVYVLTVLLGLICLMAFYLLLVSMIGRRNPLRFLSDAREVMLLAFSTSSSAAVMPVSIRTAEDKMLLPPAIVRFMVPLGATINMDGTALYQVVAAVFLTQVFGIDLTAGELILLMVTTVGASIGAPSTPGVGIVILASILESFGVPATGIALIIGVDRILDMSRTAVNVTGDLVASTVVNRWLDAAESNQQQETKAEQGAA